MSGVLDTQMQALSLMKAIAETGAASGELPAPVIFEQLHLAMVGMCEAETGMKTDPEGAFDARFDTFATMAMDAWARLELGGHIEQMKLALQVEETTQ